MLTFLQCERFFQTKSVKTIQTKKNEKQAVEWFLGKCDQKPKWEPAIKAGLKPGCK